MSNNKKIVTVIVLIFISILLLVILFYKEEDTIINQNNNNNQEIEFEESLLEAENIIQLNDLENHNEYFLVQEAINKYILSMINRDTEETIEFLNNNYIMKKNITENNIYDNINYYNSDYEYSINKIKTSNISNTNIVYIVECIFVKNEVTEDMYTIRGEEKNEYYVIHFDTSNNTLSITPTDQTIINKNEITENDANYTILTSQNSGNLIFDYTSITDKMLTELYFYHFKTKYLYQSDYVNYENNDNVNKNLSLSSSILSYEISNDKSSIIIRTNDNIELIYSIDSVLNYFVTIN